MHTVLASLLPLALLSALPAVSAHGWLDSITAGGKTYPGGPPDWYFKGKTPRPVWYALNQDHGFVDGSEYGSQNITCHKAATSGQTSIPVKAGDTIQLHWVTPEGPTAPWRTTHEGPILNYLARCKSECTQAKSDELNFFKIEQVGMLSPPDRPKNFGYWASDILRNNKNTWNLKIPSNLSGNFVLRHEIIALMSAGNLGHAQNYPQCVNLKISGPADGGAHPCLSGAECKKGPALYTQTEPGLHVSIWKVLPKYTMPGPAIWKGFQSAKRMARAFVA